MGLYDIPNPCNVNISPFDTNLLALNLSDVEHYAPESLVGLSSEVEGCGVDLPEKYDFEEFIVGLEREIAGTSKMEVENAKLKAELASKIAILCFSEDNIENRLRNAAEKTSEALHLKDEYAKHLQSMLKVKHMQCESYENCIRE